MCPAHTHDARPESDLPPQPKVRDATSYVGLVSSIGPISRPRSGIGASVRSGSGAIIEEEDMVATLCIMELKTPKYNSKTGRHVASSPTRSSSKTAQVSFPPIPAPVSSPIRLVAISADGDDECPCTTTSPK